MREIKFRAWDKTGCKPCMVPWEMLKEYPCDCVFLGTIQPHLVEIMQFTGLCDKNGKEIYEGDVLKSSTTGLLFPVTWWAEKAMFRAVKGNIRLDPAKAWGNAEAIGNIWEHPHLLGDDPNER